MNAPAFIPYDDNELLLGYQKRWIADESPLKIAEKSRRTGITWAEAADACLTASAAKSAGGTNHFYVGSNKEMAREFIDAVAMWAKAFNKAAGEIQEELFIDDGQEGKEILTFVVYFASGFKVQALSSNPSNLRGMQGNVTIDEAAFHERLAEVLKAALALTMWGAKVRLISTHNGVENLFNELINDSRAGKKRYSVHRITLDDACREGLYQRICQRLGKPWNQAEEDQWKADLLRDTASEDDALEEYYCVPKAGGGAYISRALIEACMHDAPVIRFEGSAEFNGWPEHLREAEIRDWCEEHLLPLLQALNPKSQYALGEDFARTGDLSVFAPIELTQELIRQVPFMVELKNVPFKQQEQILFYICDRFARFMAGALDARGNGQYLAEQAQYRYGSGRIEAVMLSQSWYLNNMPRFKAAFEDQTIRIPRDADVLSDMRAIQVIKGIPKIPDGKTDAKKERHGDSAIALCLAYYATTMEVEDFAYHAIPKPTRNDHSDTQQRQIRTTGGFRRGCL
ncbi:terminase large subunit domain-containing protein [Oceanobacter sp. 4_MG-2023]|uniref:terminase large subunit domain-containing protein n=1 Tax=Oceanobacter sp. 4_MG-2023 TaxID=3062623 RepID=UPI0027328E5B|nr:terminase family protein [Oceanobacter sp. 4_MG-2023]MDP2548496.1 terminase family protein [Oceanobacter sp. 4_MG-2023]